MAPETEYYNNLPVYIPKLESAAVLTQRIGDHLVLKMPDGTWRNLHGSLVYILH